SSQKSQNVKWPAVPDLQLAYLTAQLQNIKTQKYMGAVLIAVHHPPFSYAPPSGSGSAGGIHGGSTAMLREIDTICKAQGVYPHAFLSGHAHNYQRYTRSVNFAGSAYTVPFVICGNSGHNVTSLTNTRSAVRPVDPAPGADVRYLDPHPGVSATGLTID